MKIEHIAIWVKDIERMKNFYMRYFGAESNSLYVNEKKGFASYFLTFSSGSRLELMKKVGVNKEVLSNQLGWAHVAFSVGSKDEVDTLTKMIREDGYTIKGNPRTTGDGYYESVIEDPEGNTVEITI
ncbi:VOC family protein [Terribacillus saccharophilus]|jgi:lactoylglutathione lyase|uniref:Glyoxalase/bleomycin resistance/extradiol dioxygenase family protein n=1 Tax=Terribacillus saccharophilus TaxID=361277 RepID=A0ABX4H439_9BACI|nr:VOC family protein [Terribacillus saccharophilus]PAD34135.1 glyoxalase/bleomycin resistance/extradiol dioxygenase family protein [Terribacillus saccharophilus]PAD98019.1 glyoxalase/bleomycin resistance/extradiol dioxygenase family protein [Terribacillus saccharophilus]PAE01795.1 glyoxalase/bleomycin resistance/extradiol dioxygenase family protein [Terribacillus saccharophilus]